MTLPSDAVLLSRMHPTWRAADDQHCIVVDPPCFDLGARILDRREQRDVQTLIAQPTG